jgi:hypothetical protein
MPQATAICQRTSDRVVGLHRLDARQRDGERALGVEAGG